MVYFSRSQHKPRLRIDAAAHRTRARRDRGRTAGRKRARFLSERRRREHPMYQVVKRDGKVVDFDLSKIGAAITKAFEAQNRQYTQSIIDLLALRATADYEKKIKDGLVHVEDIQDTRGSGAGAGRLRRRRQGLYPLPQAAGEDPQYEVDHSGLQGAGRQLRQGHRLAREGEFDRHLLGGRADPFQLAARSRRTTGCRRSTTRKSRRRTATRTSTCTICPC